MCSEVTFYPVDRLTGETKGEHLENKTVSACSQTSIVISSFPPRKVRASEVTEHSGWDLGHNSGVKSIRAKTSCCRGPRTHPDLGDMGQECRIIGVRVLRNQSYFPKSRTAEVSLWQIFHYFEKNNSIKKKKKATYIVYTHRLIPFLYLVLTSLMSHPVLLFFAAHPLSSSLYILTASPNPQLKQGLLPPVVKSHSWGRASLGGLTVYSPGAAEGHHKN